MTPGAELILDLVDFDRQLQSVEAVVTGEGQIDATSLQGKLPAAIVTRCCRAGVPSIVFGGRVDCDPRDLYALGASSVFRLSGDIGRTEDDLVELGEALGRLLSGPAA